MLTFGGEWKSGLCILTCSGFTPWAREKYWVENNSMIYWGHVCVWACYTNSSSFLPYTFTSTKHIDSTSFLEVCIFLFFFFCFLNPFLIFKPYVMGKAKNPKGVRGWFLEVYTDFMKFIQLSKILREMHGDQLQCYYGDDKPWNGKKKKKHPNYRFL